MDETEENIRPMPWETVKVKDCNRTLEVMWALHQNKLCRITRIDSETYIENATGEVKQFQHIENRAQDKNGVRVSLARLRDYLNTNINDVKKCRWVTLTYAENMTDSKRLHDDFFIFNRRCRKAYGNYEYITAAEPQGRGAWHLHVVMIWPEKAPFIPNEKLRQLWGQGFVVIKKLEDVDNVGAYLTAYLGDMDLKEMMENGEIPVNCEIKDVETDDEKTGKRIKKRIVKGARLHLYPPNFNLYRCSKGIKKPVIEYMLEKNAQKKVRAGTLTYEKTIELDTQKGFQNTLNYRYYNMVSK